MSDKPDDLHAREYAMQIMDSLTWPVEQGKSPNLLLIAECLISISRNKSLTYSQAHSYMVRAIKLAREQGVKVDRFFFRDGTYAEMRPVKKLPEYRPMTADEKRRLAEDQASPEYKAWEAKLNDLLKKLSGQTKMEAK